MKISPGDIDAHLLRERCSSSEAARALDPLAEGVDYKRLRLRCEQQRAKLVRLGKLEPVPKKAAAETQKIRLVQPGEKMEPRRPDGKFRLDALDPIGMAVWILGAAGKGLGSAAPGSIAYFQGLRAVKVAHDELEQLRAVKVEPESSSLTLAEVCAKLEAEVREVPESLLEVAVVEWARRHKLRVAADARGRPVLLSATG